MNSERDEGLTDELEELEDVVAFDAALAEDAPSIPWETVKAEFGWTDPPA